MVKQLIGLIACLSIIFTFGQQVSALGIETTFNNPYGSESQRRVSVDRVIDYINAAKARSYVRAALYSIGDARTVSALLRARDRGVYVQLVVNYHLQTESYKVLAKELGTDKTRGNFIFKCSGSCRGSGTGSLHSKFYMFSDSIDGQSWAIGATHPTQYSMNAQWNDLVFAQDQCVYEQMRSVFIEMIADKAVGARSAKLCGKFYIQFYPQPVDPSKDMFSNALAKVRCSGANGGTGKDGRTIVRIDAYNWSGVRGRQLALRVKQLHSQGCRVHVLYGNQVETAIRTDARYLKNVPHTNYVANSLSTHGKSMMISGVYGSDNSARLVYTGSLNFISGQDHRDEAVVRIDDPAVYQAYTTHYIYMLNNYGRPAPAARQQEFARLQGFGEVD